MFTTLFLFAVLPLVAGLLYLLAVVRVWRSEQILAVMMFLFSPVGLYVLVKYWGDKEAGVRTPLLASFGTAVLWLAMLAWGASYQPALPPDGFEDDGLVQQQDEGDGLAEKVRRSVALASLPSQGGRVDFPGAHASIDVPVHFRFIDRSALEKAFADTVDAPGEHLLGWLVHEKVDLSATDAWHIEVGRLADGWISDETFAAQSRETLLAAGKPAMKAMSDAQSPDEPAFSLVGYPELPRMNAADHSVAWVEEIAYDSVAAHVLDCYAVRLGREGGLLFEIADMPASRQELCLRAVRLMAARSGFEQGRGHADRSRLLDKKAPYDLVGLITGTWVAAQK